MKLSELFDDFGECAVCGYKFEKGDLTFQAWGTGNFRCQKCNDKLMKRNLIKRGGEVK